ncbi:MAG TPA: 5-(carboxyamino)imidazole ribonucleotide synthase, partial [Gemmatimonadaceae bacterium]|nr:5-(carboxyamino)imidazole ribonucleotide synthase [Gemmatimonadaceae bacterium]
SRSTRPGRERVRVGVLGGGQLGRMLALAGYQLGIEFRFFDPNAGAPVGQIGQLIAANYDDHAALERFLEGVDVVTYEFESIPVSTVRFVAERMNVFPPPKALATAQDRLLEKQLFTDLEIPTPAFAPVDNIQDLQRAAARIGLPLVLKTRKMGYDGKGQAVIRDAASLEAAWNQLGGSPLIVEQFVEFQHELSVIGARDTAGREVFYPPIENVHREGILRKSTAPAPNVTQELASVAIDYCRRVMDRLSYVGVLALELFSADGVLLANEMAPRVHNSGHWTIEGAETSQFENHLRAVLSLPLGATTLRGNSVMFNIIGHIPPMDRVVAVEGAHLHLYGKAPTEKRKVGHVTLVAPTEADLEPGASAVRAALGLGSDVG